MTGAIHDSWLPRHYAELRLLASQRPAWLVVGDGAQVGAREIRRGDLVARTPLGGRISLEEICQRDGARKAIVYRPVILTGRQAAAVGRGFAAKVARNNYTMWACSILPEHTHLVIARHTYKVEQIANLLKDAATSQLMKENCHPLAAYARPGKRPPRMWAEHEWKTYLDSEDAIEDAIRYVDDNPVKESKPRQKWSFLTAFTGIRKGGWTTYH